MAVYGDPKGLIAILVQQHYNLADSPKPVSRRLGRDLLSIAVGADDSWMRLPQLPDPDTPDNRIASNDFGLSPVALVAEDSDEWSFSHQLPQGSSSLSKRVEWPVTFSCTAGNG